MLTPKTIKLAAGPHYAAFTSMLPDGGAQTHPMWVSSDDEFIYLNTERDRQKWRNVVANPKVTVLIVETGSPFSWVELRGEVVELIDGPEARGHIDELSLIHI